MSPHYSRWTSTPKRNARLCLRIVATLCLRGARLGPILFHEPLGFHWETISAQTLPVTVTGSSVKQMSLHAAQESLLFLDSGS